MAREPAVRVLRSKLTPPFESRARLPRPALVRQMLESRTARLVLVRAPGGFGKTTLLQQYRVAAQEAGRAVLWLNLDASDNDIDRFAAHLEAGFEQIRDQGEPARQHGDAPPPDLIERIGDHDQPFTIVLDEFEVIQGAAIFNYVQRLLEALPPQGTLVIASRTLPDIRLGRIRARGGLLEIGPSALRFSLTEATNFVREQQHLPLKDKDIATLHRCTEGWATAIFLATLSLHDRSDPSNFLASFSGSNRDVAQFLAEDVLARQDESSRDFLLRSSILDAMCAELCDAALGRGDSREMIERLERAGLFLFRLDDEGRWYRYHSLFASFLRTRLQREQPGMAASLHRAAAAWYLQEGRPLPAIEHLLDAGAEAEALDAIAGCAQELQEVGRLRLLARWFDRISPVTLARRPRLGITRAWILTLNRRHDDAMKALDAVLEAPEVRADPALFELEAQSIRCLVLAMTDRIEECIELALPHIESIPLDQAFPYAAVANSLAYSMVATCRYDEARQVLSRAVQRHMLRRSSVMRGVADAIEGNIDLLQGRLGQALARLQTAHERFGASAGTGSKSTFGGLLACALYESDELDEAERVLADALPFIKSSGSNDALVASHLLTARIAYLRGDADLNRRILAELEQIGHGDGHPRLVCSAWLERARQATLEGRLDAAQKALRSAELYSQWMRPGVSPYANDTETPFFAQVRLDIALGNGTGLPEALRAAIHEAETLKRCRRALGLRVLLAAGLQRLGEAEAAHAALTEALRAASGEGYLRVFLDEGEPLQDLVRRWAARHQPEAAALGIAPHFVAALLDRLGAQTGGDAVAPPDDRTVQGGDALSSRELQVLKLLALGQRNKVIADKLFLSEFTVKSHLRNINSKLGAGSRTEAVAIARRHRLID